MANTDASPDRSALVYRYHERLYRLALLTAGDSAAAATLLQRAFAELAGDTDDAEAQLLRALLPKRPPRQRWSWHAGAGDLPRSTLDRARADALLGVLARLAPAQRLAIGLCYIGGHSPAEIDALLGPSAPDLQAAVVLAQFRAEAARATGLVHADAAQPELLRLDAWLDGMHSEAEALELRREILEQTGLRELRDGMIAVRELLRRAIPALFVAAPPYALTAQLLDALQTRPRAPGVSKSTRQAQALLALGVLALAAAIIVLPALLARQPAPGFARAATAPDLIEAAMHRFDRAPVQSGVLHEQYRVDRERGGSYIVERWYDYAAPNRLALSVKQEGRDEPLMQLSSDGRSLVQFRDSLGAAGRQRAVDAHVTAEEAQEVLPLLRGQPLTSLFTRGPNPGDLGPLYLAQARAANATLLGQTTMLNRQAFLLTYHTERPPQQSPRSAAQPAQVVLTIDAQTYALLDVALIAEGAAESSARHPLQALEFALLQDVPDERFHLLSSSDVVQRSGIASVRLPDLPEDLFLSIEDVARRSTGTLLAPQELPDSNMRGLVVAAQPGSSSLDVVLLYEGEFQNLMLMPGGRVQNSTAASEERSVGDFRYRILRNFGGSGALTAEVYRAETPDQRLVMIFDDEYATAEEREAKLQSMIASLTPVDAQSLPMLRRNFQTPDPAAGGS